MNALHIDCASRLEYSSSTHSQNGSHNAVNSQHFDQSFRFSDVIECQSMISFCWCINVSRITEAEHSTLPCKWYQWLLEAIFIAALRPDVTVAKWPGFQGHRFCGLPLWESRTRPFKCQSGIHQEQPPIMRVVVVVFLFRDLFRLLQREHRVSFSAFWPFNRIECFEFFCQDFCLKSACR